MKKILSILMLLALYANALSAMGISQEVVDAKVEKLQSDKSHRQKVFKDLATTARGSQIGDKEAAKAINTIAEKGAKETCDLYKKHKDSLDKAIELWNKKRSSLRRYRSRGGDPNIEALKQYLKQECPADSGETKKNNK